MLETAVVLLAGGEARRFPGKLEHRIDGEPMLARCYRRVRGAGWPVYLAGKGSFSRELDDLLNAPMVLDRRPRRGPAQAFLGACSVIPAARLFAVAADEPQIDAALLERIGASWKTGDEAVVPVHDREIEPLTALYDRAAVLAAGFELRKAEPSMRDVIAKLAARFIPCDARYFHNVNRREDLLGP